MRSSIRTAFALAMLLLASITTRLLADDSAFMATGLGEFGTINLNTGVFAKIGDMGLTSAGLGALNGNIYAATFKSAQGTIYTVNTATAAVTQVGAATSVNYYDLGSTLTGLYALDTSLNLYSINPTTGVPTLLGPTGAPLSSWYGMSTNSATLYMTFGANLYTLNTTTGAATLVGGTGGTQYGALVTMSGTLYAGEDAGANKVDTLNPATGAATIGSTLTGTASNFYGLAALPDPSSFSLLAVGLFGLMSRRR